MAFGQNQRDGNTCFYFLQEVTLDSSWFNISCWSISHWNEAEEEEN